MEFWSFIAVVAVIAVIVQVARAHQLQARQLRAAKEAYQAALAQLTSHPANNDFRVAALDAGRHYADLARKAAGSNGRAIFDEVALSNDLGARSSAAPPAALPSASTDTKKCPQCAELVKHEARICRFCQHKFQSAA